jgi:hypothetical protein
MTPMTTSKDRLRCALEHRAPDRVPIDFGGSAVTGLHVTCVAALREYFGLERRPVKVHEPYQMLGLVEDDLAQAIGADIEGAFLPKTIFSFRNANWKSWRAPWGDLEVLVPGDFNTTVGANGDIYIYPEGDLDCTPSGRMPTGSYFFDAIIRQEPICEERLDPSDNLQEFGPISDTDLDLFRQEVCRAAATGRAVLASLPGTALGDIALVPGLGLKQPKGIRDVAEWYISTRTRRNLLHKIFENQCEFAIANLERIKQATDELMDAVFTCGTDFGTQTSTFCSVETFRELYFPYYKSVNGWIHRNTSWKIFKHSCGSVERFIPSFIEAGFDILNPVQCSAARMEPEHLKSAYGDRIAFWGGGVDTQKTLPFGRPAQVREEVLRRCEVFSRQGGFVFNSIHNVQAGTPLENVVAMIEAVREFNGAQRC